MVAFALRLGSSDSQALDFRDPTVWLTSSATGDIVQANANSGEITARVAGLGAPGDSLTLRQVDAGAVVLNRTKGEVVKIDPVTQKVTQRAAVQGANTDSVLLGRPDQLRVVTPAAVYKVDPESGTPGPPIAVPRLQQPVLDDDGVVWGLDGGRVVGVSDRVNEVHIGADVTPEGVVGSGGDAFVIDARGGDTDLLHLQPKAWRAGGRDCTGGPIPSGATLGGTAERDAGVVIAADAGTGLIHLTDTRSGTCATATVKDLVGARFGTPVEAGGYAYLPVTSTAEVVVIHVADASVAGRYPLLTQSNHPVELIVKDGTVWFNQPDGNAAGVLGRDRVVRHINKYDTEGLAAPGGGQPGPATSTPGTASGGTSNGVTIATPGGSGGDNGGGSNGGGSAGTNTVGSAGDPGAETINSSAGGGANQPSEQQNREGLVADFTFSARRVQVGETVSFTDTSTGGPTAWTWEFGDGAFATGPKVSHAWSIPGSFRVSLRVENASATSSASTTIEVVGSGAPAPPKADFRYSSSRVVVGDTVTFTDRSTGKPTDLRWNFGDGTSATGPTATHAWRVAGTYSVTLTATNAQGNDTSAPAIITVFDRVEQPTAIIGGGAAAAKVGQTVFYFSRSTGNPTDLKWTFGDGTTAIGDIVSHVWARPGTFTVTLEASNSAGSNTATSSITISEVAQRPEARFVASADRAEENQAIRFTSLSTNSPTRLDWDFGDGTTGTGSTVMHAFRKAGVYTVTLRAENLAGNDTVSEQITVVSQLPPPAAAFTYSPEAPAITTLTPVRFADTSTGGAPTSWSWDFDDGSPESAQQNPVHIFNRTGTYTVRLTVSNARGSTTTTRSVTVAPAPPIADFSWSPTQPRTGQLVQFTDRSIGGEVSSWSWDFGDGTTSTDRNPTHAFAEAKTYRVQLTVRNATDTSARVWNVAVDQPAPVASFDYNPKAPTTATPVTFVNTSTGGPATSVEWDFGDGTPKWTQAAPPPPHTFAKDGKFDVTLRLSNGRDPVSTFTQTVTVTVPAPEASFTVGATRVVGTAVSFTNTSKGGPFADADIEWDFGDGTPKVTGPAPTHVFAAAQPYKVTLTARNGGGTTTTSQDITIYPVPVAAFDMSPAADPIVNQVITFTDKSTGGPFAAADIQWHFDDGSTQTGSTITKSFATAGDHWVTLTVKNTGGGANTSAQTTIHVRPVLPQPTFTYANAGGSKVTFTGSSPGDPIISWSWNFGDGTPAVTGKTVTHEFTGDGPFTVTLTVTNETGAGSTSQSVSMAAPAVSAAVGPPSPAAGQSVTFTNTSTGGPFTSVTWRWDDGTADSSGNSATHTFTAAKTYKVRLTVTNGAGSFFADIDVVVT